MGKHKKFIKAEKAKTKLKGAKLPKGLNVTKTEFKVKKIVIKEQLKEVIIEDGKKKQNVKELLVRLKHHNSSFRSAAIRSISEYFTNQQDEIHQNLGPLIQGISSLALDIEKDIRREAFKLLGTLFTLVPPKTIEPFFEVLSSYLRCAMTHIQQTIQEDSLLMLDVLLIHIPHLVAGNSHRIFSNFLDMISKFRTDAKPGRTLTSNVGNKVTTIKWRTRILERLKEMLATMIQHKKKNAKYPELANEKQMEYNIFIPNVAMHFPLQRTSLNKCYDLQNVLVRSRDLMKETESNRLKTYISQLIPLLFESWLEVRSYEKEEMKRGEVLITNDAATTLKTILSILINLLDLAVLCDTEESDDEVCDWFRKECRGTFNEHLMNGFPYQQAKGSGVSKTKSKGQATDREVLESGGTYCINQNLDLVYLYCVLNAPINQMSAELSSNILQYLIGNISTFKPYPIDWLNSLPKCLRAILSTNGSYFLRVAESNTKSLLKTVLDCFQNEKFSREMKSRILGVLSNIVLNNDLYKSYGPNEFDGWLNNLPQLLCKAQIPYHVILTLSQFGKQKCHAFLNAFQRAAYSIIENLPTIKVIGCDDQFEVQKCLMNIFYWIDGWSSEEKLDLAEYAKQCLVDEKIKNYILFIILHDVQ